MAEKLLNASYSFSLDSLDVSDIRQYTEYKIESSFLAYMPG